MNNIRLDMTNVLAERAGVNGLSREEIAATGTQLDSYREKLKLSPYPFMELPFNKYQLDEIKPLAARYNRGNIKNMVILGIGGSALGAQTIFDALLDPFHNFDRKTRGELPRHFVLDNIDPHRIRKLLNLLEQERDETLLVVISKSGETPETASQFMILKQYMEKTPEFKERVVIITDSEKGMLREIAIREGYRTLPVPSGVGGRFSVLTPVGLFPAAVVGIDIDEMAAGAAEMALHIKETPQAFNIAIQVATILYLMERKGKGIHVIMPYCDRLAGFASWFRQLEAESLGKGGLGPTPVVSIGVTDQHSQLQLYIDGPQDKCIMFLYSSDERVAIPGSFPYTPGVEYLAGRDLNELFHAEFMGTILSLTEAKRPNITLYLDKVNPRSLGALFFLHEMITTFMGHLYGLNTFDQPGVERGKNYAKALMGKKGLETQKAEIEKGFAGKRQEIIFPF